VLYCSTPMTFSFNTPAGASVRPCFVFKEFTCFYSGFRFKTYILHLPYMQTPTFSFGGTSAPAFGSTATPLAKTASSPLLGGGGAPSAAASTPSLFGPSSTPAFSFASSQPGQQPASSAPLFGASSSAPTFGFGTPSTAPVPASSPFSFTSAPATTAGLFGAPQTQMQPALQLSQFGFGSTAAPSGAPTQVPDDSAIKELQSIRDSYVAAPGNYRYRFQYLFLNIIENPAARIKPPNVDELQWREAIRRAGGEDNPNHLWPVVANGFGALLARKRAQDEAIREYQSRLEAVQGAVASLAARHDAILRVQLESIKRRHLQLCQQLMRILRYLDTLEGRFAVAMGYDSSSPRQLLQRLRAQLTEIERALEQGSAGGLEGKAEALLAAARLRAGSGGQGSGLADIEAVLDPSSFASAFEVLSGYAEAIARLQAVLRRDARDVEVLSELEQNELT
jgi:nuclear pore complex protein Nup54